MNNKFTSNLLCERRIQNCLYDFSMNEILDIIREVKLIKFYNKNNSYNNDNKILYGLDLSKVKNNNIPFLTFKTPGIFYDINLKVNLLDTVIDDNGEVKNYFKNDSFKIQSNDVKFYEFFCKREEMDENYNPYLDESKESFFANIIMTNKKEYYIKTDIELKKNFKYIFLAGRVVDDYTSIDTNQMLVLQHSTLQHLLTENNNMRKNINDLQSTNDSLTCRLETLEANILKFMNSN